MTVQGLCLQGGRNWDGEDRQGTPATWRPVVPGSCAGVGDISFGGFLRGSPRSVLPLGPALQCQRLLLEGPQPGFARGAQCQWEEDRPLTSRRIGRILKTCTVEQNGASKTNDPTGCFISFPHLHSVYFNI